MRKTHNLIFVYAALLGLFAASLFAIAAKGRGLQSSAVSSAAAPKAPEGKPQNHLSLLLLQALTIIVFTRGSASAMRRLGQPAVIGEVFGGILLGPSALGALAPGLSAALFPFSSLGYLQLLSQIGLLLFMFVVGMELDIDSVKEDVHSVVLISQGSVLFPFLSGSALALFLYRDFAPAQIAFLPFCLFLGIAMSITAFPVLARIISERGLSRSPLGSMALACAAVGDVTAWCGLAVVVAVAKKGGMLASLGVTGLCGLYIAAMLFLVRPALRRLFERLGGKTATALSLLTLLASALATETIGVHALFGAFMAGLVMPRAGAHREVLAGRVEDLSTIVLLPLFFALTGLRTEIGLLGGPGAWAACLLVTAVAVLGKLGGAAVMARFSGMSWPSALSLGALMNTRGLVELVVLNIGYDLGIITPAIFTMMVVMALTTTMMTGPLLTALLPASERGASRYLGNGPGRPDPVSK